VISIEPDAIALGVGTQEAAMDEPNSVEDYLAALPDDAHAKREKLRKTIRVAAPMATEGISYGIPAFKHRGALVWFAAFKDHFSFFPMSPKVIEEHEEELKSYDLSKGTIRFPTDEPLPAAPREEARQGEDQGERGTSRPLMSRRSRQVDR
jgi:uncharacterized protein YdhG (YjbR/CyaY superfamily)